MIFSGPGYVRIAGIPDLFSENLRAEWDSGNKDVNTLIMGRAGHSRGPKGVQVSGTDAVPADPNVSFDWVGLCMSGVEVQIEFVVGGRSYPMIGDLRTTGIETSADAPNRASWTYHARMIETGT